MAIMRYCHNNLSPKFITLRLMKNNRDSYKPLSLRNQQLPSFVHKAVSGMLTAAKLMFLNLRASVQL